MNTNVKRGLLRLWFILSSLWLCVGVIFILVSTERFLHNNRLIIPLFLFIPPIIFLILGHLGIWIRHGFLIAEDSRLDTSLGQLARPYQITRVVAIACVVYIAYLYLAFTVDALRPAPKSALDEKKLEKVIEEIGRAN